MRDVCVQLEINWSWQIHLVIWDVQEREWLWLLLLLWLQLVWLYLSLCQLHLKPEGPKIILMVHPLLDFKTQHLLCVVVV